MELTLDFQPRIYQRPFLTAMQAGVRRAALEWHRRAGKEMVCFNWMIKEAIERPGTYYYFFPTYKQGQKILWLGMDKQGKRFINYIPSELIASRNETDMRIGLINGSNIQIIGADNIDNIVGTNIMGAVFSEYSLQDPRAWQYMSPILRESGGWAVFNFTPRGTNHATELHDRGTSRMRKDGSWFTETLTVDDTKVLSPEDIEEERLDGMEEEIIQQEYYCSRTARNRGAYFGALLENARNEGRICEVPYDPRLPVHTAWDLGLNDPTAIWFYQKSPASFRILEYYEKKNVGLEEHIKYVLDHDWIYGDHVAPHDIQVKEFGSGITRLERASELGIDFLVCPKEFKEDQIDAAASLIPICYFDATNTSAGLFRLENYVARYDEVHQVYSKTPVHNLASHGADAFQCLAVTSNMVTTGFYDDWSTRQESMNVPFDVRAFDVRRI